MDQPSTPDYEAPAVEDLTVDEGPASVQAGAAKQQTPAS
jgi:hypothetical protein